MGFMLRETDRLRESEGRETGTHTLLVLVFVGFVDSKKSYFWFYGRNISLFNMHSAWVSSITIQRDSLLCLLTDTRGQSSHLSIIH